MSGLRKIDPSSDSEIFLVAERMGKTLQEVLGKERGEVMYSRQWLVDRVRWHLSGEVPAVVYVLEGDHGAIDGHAIARIEMEGEIPFCLFSTIYIVPQQRGVGLAGQLLAAIESWARRRGARSIRYNTARDHAQMIAMLEKRGFSITLRTDDMVQLTRPL